MKQKGVLAEREGFEPSVHLLGVHTISSRAPSASSGISPQDFSRNILVAVFVALNYGGEGGIRTHVPCSSQDKSISSRPRYDHFGTSPLSSCLTFCRSS